MRGGHWDVAALLLRTHKAKSVTVCEPLSLFHQSTRFPSVAGIAQRDNNHPHLQTVQSLLNLTYLWPVEGGCSTWREPAETKGEYADTKHKGLGTEWNLHQRISTALLCCAAIFKIKIFKKLSVSFGDLHFFLNVCLWLMSCTLLMLEHLYDNFFLVFPGQWH